MSCACNCYKRQTISNSWLAVRNAFIERLNNRSLISNYALWCSSQSHHSLRFAGNGNDCNTMVYVHWLHFYRLHSWFMISFRLAEEFHYVFVNLATCSVENVHMYFTAFFPINCVINENRKKLIDFFFLHSREKQSINNFWA